MNFDGLTRAYWDSQVARVERVREQIKERLEIRQGVTIPDSDDLALAKGRRLKAAVMFLDISGFSTRGSETEEEQTNQLAALNLFFSEMVKIAEDYSGSVEKNTGDGLMVYFEDGTSSTPINGAQKAVACAMTMFRASEFLVNPILERSGIEPIKFRVCVDYGNVTISKLGSARRFSSIVAIGTTANIAGKMLDKAKAGELLLGESAKTALPASWQLGEHVVLHSYSDTGWVYRSTNQPYPFYIFRSRWSRLL